MTQPKGSFVDIGDGITMHANCVGPKPTGNSVPVVFLHGSGPGASGWSNFEANAEVLAEAGYHSILIDSVGYGLSSKPTDVDYTLPFMADCAAKLLEGLGYEHYTLVGNSQGGAQAIRIALEHPERVDKLILMAPGGLETREVYMEMRGIRSMMRCIYGPEGITLEGMHKLFSKQLHDPSSLDADTVAARTKAALEQPTHVFRTMRVDNQEARLADLACPVLGLWGVNDVFCPPTGATKLANTVPDCRVVLFNQCGHWVMVEQADRFNRLAIDFLKHG